MKQALACNNIQVIPADCKSVSIRKSKRDLDKVGRESKIPPLPIKAIRLSQNTIINKYVTTLYHYDT